MTEDDLLSHIDVLERQAVGYYTGEIAAEQTKALDYYNGRPFGTEEVGRSQVVSSDVWDVVEGLTPVVLRPFVASDEVVKFNAVSAEDEDAAEQESAYVNWVVTQKNDAFTQLAAWCKTGLLQKNGVVKYWWDVSTRSKIERYERLDDDMFALIVKADDVKVIEHSETREQLEDGSEAIWHDVVIRVVEEVGAAKYCCVPPEEFRIGRTASTPSPKDADFVQHVRKMTIGDVRAMGYDVDDDIADSDDDPSLSGQLLARRSAEEMSFGTSANIDPLSREVTFKETYLLVDFDGDGQQELRKVCTIGSTVLHNDETEEIPFAAWTPYPQPFKFYGRCPGEEAQEFQLIKSTLLRQTMDNIYTINNNRTWANERVNLDDLVDNQIAGVVRVSGTETLAGAIGTAPIQPIGGITLPIVEMLDAAKENRTGWTRYNQGTDGDSLNKTATGVRIIAEAGNQRVELIQRSFANGVADLMRGIHGLIRRHGSKSETIRLRGKWVEVDPRAWRTRSDMTVSVGLGSSDQQMRMQAIQMLMDQQKQLAQVGIVQPENFLNAAHKFTEVVGFKNPEQFFAAAGQPQVPPQLQQAMQQAEQTIQALQAELQKAQSGMMKAQVDAETKLAIERMKQDGAAMQQQANAELQRDLVELKGVIDLLKVQVQPPAQMAAEVSEDMREEDGQA